jgi:hypothetical protein
MGIYDGYEPHLANLFLFATNKYSLTFSRSFNQNSYNPNLFKMKYLVLRFTVIKILGVGSNNLHTQILTGSGYRHYFTKRNLENPYRQSPSLIKNKSTMHYD